MTGDASHAAYQPSIIGSELLRPRPRRRRGWRYLVAIVALLVCAGGVSYAIYAFAGRQDDAGFTVGACVVSDPGEQPPYKVASCADSAAYYKVLTILDRQAQVPCRDVAGASALFSANGSIVCLGEKRIDPAKAINVAKEGDCVDVQVRDAFRLDCADPNAKLQVLKRLTNIAEAAVKDACAGVPGTVRSYSWKWTSSDPIERLSNNVDVVLCLGVSQSSVAAAASQAASRSDCRFITDEEMSAAVSAGTGKTYTVTGRDDGNFGCHYTFTKPTEHVGVTLFSGVAFRPGTASQVFTLDGLRAMWTPGEGDRSLGVEVPPGVFSIHVQLTGVGDAASKKIAIAAFRSARPRIK